MNRLPLRWGHLLRLITRDLWHERWLALCTACVVAATLAPLLTLRSLERGVIGSMLEQQDRDPLVRLLEPEVSGHFDAAWFERQRARPDVSYVLPVVDRAATLVEAFGDGVSTMISLRPSSAGDPLVGAEAAPVGLGVMLDEAAARKLKVRVGDSVRLRLTRPAAEVAGAAAVVAVTVVALMPPRSTDTEDGLADHALMESVDAWRAGHTVERIGPGGDGPPPPRMEYPLFRLHARSSHDVGPLARRLESEGVHVRTRTRDLDIALGLQRDLGAVLAMVTAVTLAGAAMALTALQVATLRRKRREFALLKLTGHGRRWLMGMSLLNAAGLAMAGALIAIAVAGLGAAIINAYFGANLRAGEAAARLDWRDALVGLAAGLVISILPAAWGGWRASNVEAADELRES